MNMHADLVVATAGVHLLSLTHLTSTTLMPEGVQTWNVKLPVKSGGNQETLHQEVPGAAVVGALVWVLVWAVGAAVVCALVWALVWAVGAAVVGALVGAASPPPVAVESAVIHICTSKHFRLKITTQ